MKGNHSNLRGFTLSAMHFCRVFTCLLVALCAGNATGQWEIQDAHTKADLRGIDYVGNGVAWASGTSGTVLRTEDMGFVWQLCAVPHGAEHLDFRGIQAFDNNTAVVMSSGKGDLSRLYKTTDGCQTWKLVFTNPDKDGFWDAVQFRQTVPAGIGTGFVLGDPVSGVFRIFETESNSDQWQALHQENLSTGVGQAVFAASNSAMSPGIGFVAFVSGGPAGAFFYVNEEMRGCPEPHCGEPEPQTRIWKRFTLPLGAANASSGAFSLAWRQSKISKRASPLTVVAVGGDYVKADSAERTAAYSNDSGHTWRSSVTPPHGYRSAVAYTDRVNAWITVGPNGTDISTDDGRNWRPLKPGLGDAPDADQHWNALSLPFVVGPRGRIGLLREDGKAAASGRH